MSKLDEAQARLQRAIESLETAARSRGAETSDADGSGLRASLDAAEARCAELERLSLQMGQRLETAIGRIRAILQD